MFPLFPNRTLKLCKYSMDSYDEYGEPVISYPVVEEYSADVQQMTDSESMKQFGKILTDTYRVILNKSAKVEDKDIIRLDGESTLYRVIGSVEHWNHLLDYKEVIIQRERNRSEAKTIINNGDEVI